MTSFVAWVGVDSRGPASLYLASDSRISWLTGKRIDKWDYGRKVFAATKFPDLLGYVGDVLFPSLVLGQIVSAIDMGALYTDMTGPEIRFSQISKAIKASFSELPKDGKQPFTAFYATREGEGMTAKFHFWALSWSHGNGWHEENIPIPSESSAIRVSGSGADGVGKWQSYWDSSSQGGTSRAVFSALCDAISGGSDPCSGGAPQLVGMFRKSEAQTMGVVIDKTPYLLGLPVPVEQGLLCNIQWRNYLFERVRANGDLLQGAQKHHAPHGLAKGIDTSSCR